MKNRQLLILLVSFFFAAVSATHYESIFNFGDSLSDTGNIVKEKQIKVPRDPNGMTFFKHDTGRACDGRLIIDFIAEANALPYLPPYLGLIEDKTLNVTKIRQGVNFAVIGATAINKTFLDENNAKGIFTYSSLNVQIEWFKKIKPSLCSTQQECDKYFKRALFFVGEIGGNDVNFLLTTRGVDAKPEVTAFFPLIIQTIMNATDVLIKEGAKTLVVPGNIPFGCAPTYFAQTPELNDSMLDENKCIKKFNEMSQAYNSKLIEAIESLRHKHPSVKIIYADYYGAALQIFKDPVKFGFEKNFERACCGGGGKYNQDKPQCGDPGKPGRILCPDPSKSVSWDGVHLTEASYHVIASSLLDTFTNPPGFLNISSYA